jgi:hypothetical protein
MKKNKAASPLGAGNATLGVFGGYTAGGGGGWGGPRDVTRPPSLISFSLLPPPVLKITFSYSKERGGKK